MKTTKSVAVGLGLIFTSLLLSCSAQNDSAKPTPPDNRILMSFVDDRPFPSEWEKKRWITKTARVINGNRGVVNKTQLESLAKLKTSKIVEEFMTHERFGDFLVEFNLYFLGFRPRSIRVNNQIRDDAFRYPASITAAKEVLVNGDYFRILDFYQPLYMPALQEPGVNPGESIDDARKRHFTAITTRLDEVVELAKNLPANKKQYCTALNNMSPDFFGSLLNSGLGQAIGINITVSPWANFFDFNFRYCFAGLPGDGILEAVTKYRDAVATLLATMSERTPEKIKDTSVQGIPIFDMSAFFRPDVKTNQFTAHFWQNLRNSSTNMNRKRGAYMLKHFFCDDLTPINVLIPGDHAKGKHGSDASCYACHYKLDPMSGFFRNYGILGGDQSGRESITFDDQVVMNREDYMKNWKAEDGRGREWNIGYVRSSTDEDLNLYANTPEQLFEIIRNAPEVKKCIVKKAVQYTLGENQTVDSGYLEHLSNKFNEESKVNSSLALKDLIYSLIISDTFVNADPDPKSCYDFAPGEDPKGRPPCLVAHVFETNCATCHSSQSAKGGLDLTKWIAVGDGAFNFPHVSRTGEQYPKAQTLAEILTRLTTSDEEDRMPYKKHISTQDLETLVKWTEAEKTK